MEEDEFHVERTLKFSLPISGAKNQRSCREYREKPSHKGAR